MTCDKFEQYLEKRIAEEEAMNSEDDMVLHTLENCLLEYKQSENERKERDWQDNGWSGYIHRKSYAEIQKEALAEFVKGLLSEEAKKATLDEIAYQDQICNQFDVKKVIEKLIAKANEKLNEG